MDRNKAQDIPFATIPQNVYIRSEPSEETELGSRIPSALWIALTRDSNPNAWMAPAVLNPLQAHMRRLFREGDLMGRFTNPTPVSDDELVAIEGTDKPYIPDGDDGVIRFTRVVTPKFVKDLVELRLTPRLIDKMIAEAGTALAREMTSMFLESLRKHSCGDMPVDAPESMSDYSSVMKNSTLIAHPDVLEALTVPAGAAEGIACADVAPTEAYVVPCTVDITYRHLTPPQLWIERKAFMLEFFCYLEPGATIKNTDGLHRFTWPAAESEAA